MYFEFDNCVFNISDICGGEYYANINNHKHSKDGYEIHFDVYGKGTLTTDDGEYELDENTLYVTGPEKYHAQSFDKSNPLFEYSILIELVKYEKSELADVFLGKNFWIGKATNNVGVLFQSIAETNLSNHKCSELEMKALFNLLLAEIIRLYEPDLRVKSVNRKTSRNKTIEAQFLYNSTCITLKSLSEILSISQRQTERVLKENFGKSFSQMKKEYQIAKAIGLFNTDMSLEAIAEECGFCDVSAFHKAFKEQKNTTPAKYRKGK
ncbi:AraC family transcriptional regulator [uncultured Eubacterium sp.]|uniref:AraC family transcriptional regulator n=1 Tax=uncultured Eubacterium sp. TaxID=165185 RepID=UPI0015B97720|nr:helix-turn-helix transcriptional regulator [uncultured Eubacterium sp.]